MTDSSAQEYNCLNINTLQPPIEGGKQNDFRYSQHLSKLLRRFVRFAVPGDADISFSDRELLEIKLSGKQIGLEYSVENPRREVIQQANEKRMRRTDLGAAHLCPDHLCDRETKENN